MHCRFLSTVDAETDDGLCCRLTKACPKDPEPIPFRDLEVNKSEIVLSSKLGHGQFGEVWAGKTHKRLFLYFCRCVRLVFYARRWRKNRSPVVLQLDVNIYCCLKIPRGCYADEMGQMN